MKSIKLILSVLAICLISYSKSYAQQAVPAAGGDAVSADGSVAFSVGQVVYTTNTDVDGSVAQGVQQPYIITVISGLNQNTIQLIYSVYPNPTTNFLVLNISNYTNQNLTYSLFDVNGKSLANNKITGSETNIPMSQYAAAAYILRVSDNNKEIKSFKIIKN
jgi:hypothetical protein